MIKNLCEKLEFPKEAIVFFEETYEKILNNKEVLSEIKKGCDEVFLGDTNESYVPYVRKAAEILEIEYYTVNMVFWLMCTVPMKYVFKSRNIPEEKYYETLKDLKTKLDECKTRFNIWGSASNWYRNFYRGNRLAFGRLQYDVDKWEYDDYKDFVKKGDLIFRCHIPSGSPLYTDAVMDSLKELYNYYKADLKDGILVMLCRSWLIYPPMIAICKEDSNMKKFYDLFDIINEKPAPAPYSQFLNIFNQQYVDENSLENAPENTSFQRSMKKYFKEGKNTGTGFGVLLFDGEKIIKEM